jgi:hypothetical protein
MPVKKRRTISLNLAALANPKTGYQQAVILRCRRFPEPILILGRAHSPAARQNPDSARKVFA